VVEVRQTDSFKAWFQGLRDANAKHRILARITRLELGNYGDVKSVGGGVSELRIDYGPGYRLYLTKVGNTIVLLLCGGTKKSQSRDIAKANKMAKSIR
jgi:putative addiction module killer protein